MKTDNIVIVGGGTSGWMSATTFIRLFPNKKITLIEAPNIPTVSVGESTLQQFRKWCYLVNIHDKDFMKDCDASYKLNVRFTNFHKKDSGHFDYPFGLTQPLDERLGVNVWHIKKAMIPETPLTDYADSIYPVMSMVNKNKIYKNEDGLLGSFDFYKQTAFHFDAGKFVNWLKEKICIPEGLNYIQSEVKKVKLNENGIDSLELENGKSIKADLFIDCTGFKSLLLGESLGEEFIPYNNMLPNNKAWATHVEYTDKEKELVGYTNCTAINNGWVWNIPLWSKIGTGYVYSDKFISDEDALEEFKKHLKDNGYDISKCEYKNIPMKVGIHKKLFVKNVCAIGLSAGFVEPLESNGLWSVHEFLVHLIRSIERGNVSQFDRDTFNHACRLIFQNWAEFVSMHFALSERDDTPYWKANLERNYDVDIDSLKSVEQAGFRSAMHSMAHDNRFNDESGIACISTGMNWLPVTEITLKHGEPQFIVNYDKYKQLIFKMNNRKIDWDNAVRLHPTMLEFLKKEVYNEL